MRLCEDPDCFAVCNHCTHGTFSSSIRLVRCVVDGKDHDPLDKCGEFTCFLIDWDGAEGEPRKARPSG